MQECLKDLAAQQQLKQMGLEMFNKYKCVFEPIPHADELPTNVYCQINSKTPLNLLQQEPIQALENIRRLGEPC